MKAIGLVETNGLIGLVAATDAMDGREFADVVHGHQAHEFAAPQHGKRVTLTTLQR